MSRQTPHPGAHRVTELWARRFLAWCRWGRTFYQSWRGGIFFGGDLHVATSHRGDALYMGAVDKVAEEGGTEVTAGMETRQDEVWMAWLAAFIRTDILHTDRLDT